MDLLTDGVGGARTSRGAPRRHLSLNWPRVSIVAFNVAVWALIVLMVRHFLFKGL